MTLFCLLCVSLVLGGWIVRREVRTALGNLWLHFFGVRVRVLRRQELPAPDRLAASASPHGFPPPPQVVTRPGA